MWNKFYKKLSLRKHLVVRNDLVPKKRTENLNVANVTKCLLQAETLIIIQ